jgi:hypothetical protein
MIDLELGGVLVEQLHIRPVTPLDQLACLGQHPLGRIDADDGSARTDRIDQVGEVAPGAGADLQNCVAGLQPERRHRLAASERDDQIQRLKRAVEASDTVVLAAVGALGAACWVLGGFAHRGEE